MTAEPDLLVIGAMRAGSTSLYRYLAVHPQIQMSTVKEVHFFSRPEAWERGWVWYLTQFPDRDPGSVAMGEVSPSYTRYPLFPDVPERIARYLPQVRLLYVVRDPIARMRSHYLHEVAMGRERRPVARALMEDPQYLSPSLYGMQLERYLACFSREQIMVITSEQLRHDRAATMSRVYAFLGADASWWDPELSREFNVSAGRIRTRPATRVLRRVPRLRRAVRRLPGGIRRIGARSLDPSEADLDVGTGEALRDRLRSDVAVLRRYLGPGFEGWGLL